LELNRIGRLFRWEFTSEPEPCSLSERRTPSVTLRVAAASDMKKGD
jgi:hypothetical protein